MQNLRLYIVIWTRFLSPEHSCEPFFFRMYLEILRSSSLASNAFISHPMLSIIACWSSSSYQYFSPFQSTSTRCVWRGRNFSTKFNKSILHQPLYGLQSDFSRRILAPVYRYKGSCMTIVTLCCDFFWPSNMNIILIAGFIFSTWLCYKAFLLTRSCK